MSTRITLCLAVSAVLAMCGGSTPAYGEDIQTPMAIRRDPQALHLRAGEVPLPQVRALPSRRMTSGASVIQLDGPITPARRQRLEAAGVALGDYLPMHAYITDLSNVDPDALDALAFVRWTGPYERAWKLAPNLDRPRAFATQKRQALAAQGAKRLTVHLFRGAIADDALQGLDRCGASVEHIQLTGDRCSIEIEIDGSHTDRLADIADVMFVEQSPEATPRNSTTTWICQSNVSGVTPLWDAGLHGEGQVVGLIDWDLDENHCAFTDINPIGPLHRKLAAYYGLGQNTAFGWHGTHVGGILTGDELADTNPDLKGMAYASRLAFQDQAATITNTNLDERLTLVHDNEDAHVHSNSWGSNSDDSYNAWARDIDAFSREHEDDLVVFAIINGNASTGLLSPENAKNCLAVGASGDTPDQGQHGSGGIGPTTDGRQKPEVWAPGCGTTSATMGTACSAGVRSCATSYAAPAVSGMAVLVRQYFMDGFYPTGKQTPADAYTPTGALLKAMLINSAVDMDGFAGYFGPHEGWGRILVDDTVYFSGDGRRLLIQDVRNADGLSTGETDSYEIEVLSDVEPLKITLVWTDVPGTIGTALAPTNNLNLVVTAPDATEYLGNVFTGAESDTGGTADALNNAEQVHRNAPTAGIWRIEVAGEAVNVDAQGYALVLTGDIVESTIITSDCNGNGVPDEKDIVAGTSTDCDGNTVPDECDIAVRPGLDCNDNDRLDACEILSDAGIDCDGNGVPDSCDLAVGTGQDCNANGVPDECDITAGTALDCDGDGVLDTCELTDGTALDCNANGVPDECDITAGTTSDCNANGVPDACDIGTDASPDADGNGVPDECDGDGPVLDPPPPVDPTPTPDSESSPPRREVDRAALRSFLAFFFQVPFAGVPAISALPVGVFGLYGAPMSAAMWVMEWFNLPIRVILFEFTYAVLDAILP